MSFKQNVKDTVSVAISTGAMLVWIGAVLAGISAIALGIMWFSAPAQVAIENKTFHQSQAYTDGMARDLYDMQAQYNAATPAGKDAIRATVRERFAGFDASKLPPSLQAFLSEIQ